jgi:hypothetical protein
MTTYDFIMIAWGFLFGGLMTTIILHTFSKKENHRRNSDRVSNTKQKTFAHH